jgi:hypothetical protein
MKEEDETEREMKEKPARNGNEWNWNCCPFTRCRGGFFYESWSWHVTVAFLARQESPPKFQETFLLSETCQISKSFLLS